MDPLRLLILPLLLVLSAVFSSAETALFSLHQRERRRLEERGGPLARPVLFLLSRPRAVLVTILLANLVVNVFYFSVVHSLIVEARLGGFGALIASLAALFGVLIFGEIAPKTVALRRPLLLARVHAVPLSLIVLLLSPLRALLELLLALCHRLLGQAQVDQEVIGADLLDVVRRSVRQGVLGDREASQLQAILTLRAVHVRELMTPRVDLFSVPLPMPVADLRSRVREEHPEWILVHEGDVDHLLGFVKANDFLLRPEIPLRELLAPPCYIPESATAFDLVRECRHRGIAFAVVVDEFGGTAGLATVEDVLEEIVGDIRDEYESQTQALRPLGMGRFVVRGDLKIREWNAETGAGLPTKRFETLAGFLSDRLGHLPGVGESIREGDQLFRVLEVVDGRVIRIEAQLPAGERQDD